MRWGVALAVALGLVVAGCSGDGEDSGESRPSADYPVEVFMDLDATEAQIAAVRAALRAAPAVERVRFLSKADALVEFRRLFADKPDLLESVEESDLPTSFRVRLRDGSDGSALRERLMEMAGVDEVQDKELAAQAVPRDWQVRPEGDTRIASVYMSADATGAEIDAVRSALAGLPYVRRARFVDQETAYAEFQRMFADDPDVSEVAAGDLPSSFRVVLASTKDERALRRSIGRLAGVDEVIGDQLEGEALR